MENFYAETLAFLDEGQIEEVSQRIENVLKGKYDLKGRESVWKLAFASLYIDLAEYMKSDIANLDKAIVLITKTFQIYNKYGKDISDPFLINLNKARALSLRYDINYTKYQIHVQNFNFLDYTNIKSIYDIEEYLIDSLKLYRASLKELQNDRSKGGELYNIKNNLAQILSRAGRYIEALDIFETNFKADPDRWESLVCYGDILQTFSQTSLLTSTISLHLNIADVYIKAIKNKPHKHALKHIQPNLNINLVRLKKYGYEASEEILDKNKREEKDDFLSLNQFRKFVLENSLSLNEHSIYCKCRDSKTDNLKIGRLSGSAHVGSNLEILDGYVNRILSEFCYSRFLYFNHISGISTSPNDVEFSNISSDNDELGYSIEQLRSSYRLIYGVLDKIMNGVLLLYNLERNKENYFESFFFQRKSELATKNNIHLAALLSIALELNQGNGIFKHYKNIRNRMEHDYLPINSLTDNSISINDLEIFSFELLKLTRAAIFSFVFLIRTHTIINDDQHLPISSK